MHTYTKIYVHVTFATWNRIPFLRDSDIRRRLHAYLATAVRALGMRDVVVGGHVDHSHLIGAAPPSVPLSEVIGKAKSGSSKWLSTQFPKLRDFDWQRGFAAFSVTPGEVPNVVRYVENQEQHHQRASFEDELRRICEECGVAWEDIALM